MLAGFVRFRDWSCEAVASVDGVGRAWADKGARFWVDFEETAEAPFGHTDRLVRITKSGYDTPFEDACRVVAQKGPRR